LQFGIKNIRRLRDVPPIELKPITLLVGRNSSGKSSFLRLFPLLRQSLMTRTSSPILWYGDLVDFGTYSTAVSNGSSDNEITFAFELDHVDIETEKWTITEEGYYQTESRQHSNVSFEVTIGPTQIEHTISRPPEAERTTVRKIILTCESPAIRFEIQIDSQQRITSLDVDGFNFVEHFPDLALAITPGTILPELLFVTKEEESRTFRRRRGENEIGRALTELAPSQLAKSLDEDLAELISGFLARRPLTREDILSAGLASDNKRWYKFIQQVAADQSPNGLYVKMRSLVALAVLSELLRHVDQQLRNILAGVLYIGPARARSERYYRYQDLSVSEIDPDGKNFPMFLNSLSYFQVKRLSDWIESLFGYGVQVGREGGHISINLVAKGHTSNIVDTGMVGVNDSTNYAPIFYLLNEHRY
jgi:AAA ATPase domain